MRNETSKFKCMGCNFKFDDMCLLRSRECKKISEIWLLIIGLSIGFVLGHLLWQVIKLIGAII